MVSIEKDISSVPRAEHLRQDEQILLLVLQRTPENVDNEHCGDSGISVGVHGKLRVSRFQVDFSGDIRGVLLFPTIFSNL